MVLGAKRQNQSKAKVKYEKQQRDFATCLEILVQELDANDFDSFFSSFDTSTAKKINE